MILINYFELRVSYITAIFPYIMIFALIIRGATLPGAIKVDIERSYFDQTGIEITALLIDKFLI